MMENSYKYCHCDGPTQLEKDGTRICAFCYKLKKKEDQSGLAKCIDKQRDWCKTSIDMAMW